MALYRRLRSASSSCICPLLGYNNNRLLPLQSHPFLQNAASYKELYLIFFSHPTTFFHTSFSPRPSPVFQQQKKQLDHGLIFQQHQKQLDHELLFQQQQRHRQPLSFFPAAKFYSLYSRQKEEKEEKEGEEVKSKQHSSSASWVEMYLPKYIQQYALLARLDKPIGTWLLAWPCMWSITMAAPPGNLPDFRMLALFGFGALLLRGAGCTVNDLLDRDIDIKVERTKSRPIASGLVTPFEGLSFLGFQLMLGLGVLLQLNNYSRILGTSSLLLVFSYPLMKRITFWPQAYLGLTLNWGALLGWAAIRGSLDVSVVLPLYCSGVFWTLVYDTIYAHQDKEDDLKVGVKSTALRFGNLTKQWCSTFAVLCISNLGLGGFNADLAWPYYGFLAAAAAQLGWQISTVDLSNRADCNRKFVSNKWFGALVFSGVLFGRLAS